MAERPRFREYVVTVLRRSMASWGAYNWIFALAAYVSVLILPFIFTGFIGDIVGALIETALALVAIGWLIIYVIIYTSFRMWQDEKYRMNLIEESSRPKINVNWRFANNRFAELILTNDSTKTIPRVELSFRNYRNASGSEIQDVICDMVSVDGRGPSMTLDPLIQTFFRFARVVTVNGEYCIVLLPSGQNPIHTSERELGVKLTISGEDILGQAIDFRLTVNDDGSLAMGPWNAGENVVRPAGVPG